MTLPFYPFYWGDYSKKTFNLTRDQHGAYILLLRHIYCEGENIPHEQRYSIAKAMLEQERKNTDLVLKTYFERRGASWVQLKAKDVIAKAERAHENRVNAGKSPKKPRKQRGSNASVKLQQSPSNQNHNQNQLKRNIKEKGKGAKMFVLENTEAFKAWEKYRGRRINAIETKIDGKRLRGFYFPTEYPPLTHDGVTKAKEKKS